jgi:hypothetical protein
MRLLFMRLAANYTVILDMWSCTVLYGTPAFIQHWGSETDVAREFRLILREEGNTKRRRGWDIWF